MDDALDDGAQPRCARDGIVMRDTPGGWECPSCGARLLTRTDGRPAEFDGPSIHGG